MTREDALQAMIDGKYVAHRNFSSDEYIYMIAQNIFSEDGYNMKTVHDEFWRSRSGGYWEDGWEIYTGELTHIKKKETNINQLFFCDPTEDIAPDPFEGLF